ncbi:MAG TPA: hypothetical protein DDW50_06355 [Firmicutes bacterium]|jgi:hypothetical protein|nr:hypothetical protein [Bacillota bacterium]
MPLASTATARRRRARSRTFPELLQRIIITTFKFLLSPIIIFVDSFRRKETLDGTWIFSFFLFLTVALGLTGTGILVTEGPLVKTMKMMTAVTENQEDLAGDLQPIIRIINRNALANNIDPNLVYAIIKSESNFSPRAVSPQGAKGLMQIMPQVWQQYHNRLDESSNDNDIFSPEANIDVGVKYLRDLLRHYQGRVDLALEAYNAGISNVRPGNEPKFKETRGYVQNTLALWQTMRRQAIDHELQISLYLQKGLKLLFGVTFLCWLILFWWARSRLFGK